MKVLKIGCIIVLILIILGFVGYLVLRPTFNKLFNPSSKTSSKSIGGTVHKITGKAADKIPYAPIDEAKVTTERFDNNGGVLSTDLSKNVKAYFVVPAGEFVQGGTVSLIPYKEMPTSQKHGEVSDEYGYGVQVLIKSLEMGTGGYLVFDVKGGKATEEAVAKAKYFNRCDPRLPTFNPYICARTNKLAGTHIVDMQNTIVTPIFNEKFSNLIFLRNTIPTGIDGLIVTKIDNGDVFVPQKLDQPLAEKYIKLTFSKNSDQFQKLEAAGMILAWGYKNLNTDQVDLALDMDVQNDTWQARIKELYIITQFAKKTKAGWWTGKETDTFTQNDKNIAYARTQSEQQQKNAQNLADLQREIEQTYFHDIGADTSNFSNGNITGIEAAGAAGAAQGMGVAGSTEGVNNANGNISGVIDNAGKKPDDAAEAIEATNTEGTDKPTGGTGDAGENDWWNQPPAETPPPSDGEDWWNQPTQDQQRKAAADTIANQALNDPNATLTDYYAALEALESAYGDEGSPLIDKILEKIKQKIEEMIKNPKTDRPTLINLILICMQYRWDDLRKQGSDRLTKEMNFEKCNLIKKDLSNYGINECK